MEGPRKGAFCRESSRMEHQMRRALLCLLLTGCTTSYLPPPGTWVVARSIGDYEDTRYCQYMLPDGSIEAKDFHTEFTRCPSTILTVTK